MKRKLMFPLLLCIIALLSCEKGKDPEKDNPDKKEPKKEASSFLVFEAEGQKFEWKETDSVNRCLSFHAVYDTRETSLMLSVAKAPVCLSGDSSLQSFVIKVKALKVDGIYRILTNEKVGNHFQLQLADRMYRAADWERPAELEVKVARFEIKDGVAVIAGTFQGSVAKYVTSSDRECFSKMVPVKGEFRLNLTVLGNS